jgi:hypothetical protein
LSLKKQPVLIKSFFFNKPQTWDENVPNGMDIIPRMRGMSPENVPNGRISITFF